MTTVAIIVAGTDITADVMFSDAKFTSKVNGQPGEAYMRVRDDNSTYSFVEGSDWLVTIDGNAAWRGFVTSVVRTYLAPAENVAVTGLQRIIDLHGSDGNVLFPKRVVFDKATPANVGGTQFPPATADTTAITELLTNWLDLSADSIDTASGVTGVGTLDPAQTTTAWSAGWTWNNAMDSIAMLPAAIYYLRPESGTPHYTLVYCDVDTPTAPFGLSDQPNGTTTKGYRDMEIMLDGTGLANDVMEWGAGYGSQTPVFDRLTDATSVAAHGVWQQGAMITGIYKQSSINRITDSIVNGSPSHHRGAKNDRPAVQLTTYEPGLLAGHVVAFDSQVWGWSDTIPVRQMTITFEAPQYPKFDILLSHEIDAPWGFYDQFWPKIPGWTVPTPTLPGIPVLPPGGCSCGITDSFTRTIASQWGVADYGGDWNTGTPTQANESWGVSGAGGYVTFFDFGDGTYGGAGFGALGSGGPGTGYLKGWIQAHTGKIIFKSDIIPTSYYNSGTDFKTWYEDVNLSMLPMGALKFSLDTNPDSGNGFGTYTLPGGDSADYVVHDFPFSAVSDIVFEWQYDGLDSVGKGFRCRMYQGAVPSTWDVNSTWSSDVDTTYLYASVFPHFSSAPAMSAPTMTFTLVSVDISVINRCTEVQFDNFNRTVASGWGTATPSGLVWAQTDGSGGVTSSVSSATGVLSVNGSSGASWGQMEVSSSTGPWASGQFMMTTRFKFQDGDSLLAADLYLAVIQAGSAVPQVELGPSGLSHVVRVYGAVNNASASITLNELTWYTAKWDYHRNDTHVRFKAWADGTSEPGWLIDFDDTTIGSAPTAFWTRLYTFSTYDSVLTVESIDFDYAGKPCYYSGGSPVYAGASGIPTSPSGYGCVIATRSSSTVYTVPSAFMLGSTFVWRDGLFQRRGTDYTEDSDGLGVTFVDAVASTSTITICCFVAAS